MSVMFNKIEPTIIGKHNLDVSSLEALANDLASRLNLNIEFGLNDFANDTFISSGAITTNDTPYFFRLFPEKMNQPDEVSYILELGDGAKIIYKEIVNLNLPYPLAFDDLKEEHFNNPRGILTEGILKDWIEDLMKLGTNQVYFIGDYNTEQSGLNYEDEKHYSWSEFTSIIQQHCDYFIEPKQ